MDFDLARKNMVEQQLKIRGIKDPSTLEIMEKTPRHLFVPENEVENAYADCALPIGSGQTISQPYMVAKMTECLDLHKNMIVLEIGTGSGYQTAILAQLVNYVYTMERIPLLSQEAKELLTNLGYKNIECIVGNGSIGLKIKAPFDRIIVTAAAAKIPKELTEQLKDNGKLVIPMGTKYFQTLTIITKRGEKIETKEANGCIFVPLVGKYGW